MGTAQNPSGAISGWPTINFRMLDVSAGITITVLLNQGAGTSRMGVGASGICFVSGSNVAPFTTYSHALTMTEFNKIQNFGDLYAVYYRSANNVTAEIERIWLTIPDNSPATTIFVFNPSSHMGQGFTVPRTNK